MSFRNEVTATLARPPAALQAERRVAAAQANFNARMKAAEERFERERSLIRATYVAEISGSGQG